MVWFSFDAKKEDKQPLAFFEDCAFSH